MSDRIAVLGAGSWGIAIANLLASNDHDVTMWEYNPVDFELLSRNRAHDKKLPGIRVNSNIYITNDLNDALRDIQIVVLANPAQTMRKVAESLNGALSDSRVFVNLAKGIEIKTNQRMSEVLAECINVANESNIATMSGPSHAEEVSRGIPTSVVVASKNLEMAEYIQGLFSNNTFRTYRSDDIIGVELGGSVKNVIAIAAGIISGLGMGDNTMGALITRGLYEISRLGEKMGADPMTFAGLSGIGDLVTTCTSRHSRNHQVGFSIGKGETLRNVMSRMVMVAEGVDTSRSVKSLAVAQEIEMPIADKVYDVLFNNKEPGIAISELMERTLKQEAWNLQI